MKSLELWSEYTRKEIHSIFSPDTPFTPQAGTWGLHGMIRVPGRQNDWVFLVSLGNQQGEHIFDESITVDGVLSWQSQPRLDLVSDAIKSLINHDDRVNNIHLFLRTKKSNPYAYFGCLGYLTHDTEREKPVYFQWQVLDWPAPDVFLDHIGLKLTIEKRELEHKEVHIKQNELIFAKAPKVKPRNIGVKTSEFRSRKSPDYGLIDSKNKKLGLDGELLVLQQEIKTLRGLNLNDLANKVFHVSVVEGDGAGYDIKSYDAEGNVKYIEVKTTKGSATTSFFISPNELEFSKQYKDHYFLYRIFEFEIDKAFGKVFVIRGDLSSKLNIIPTQFKAQLSENTTG